MSEKFTPGNIEISRAETSQETAEAISYLGVELPKAEVRSDYVPKVEAYADFTVSRFEAELQRDIAESMAASEPCLIEGGTSLGKTTTVRKMCAELGYEVHYINLNGNVDVEALMGQYIPNPNKHSADDPEFVFADGPITRALRVEPGKTKVILLDELNSARPETLIRLHEVIDALERNSTVTLSEDASEVVETDHNHTKLVGLMNPPGRGYIGREPLDPALLRRWNYRKLPDELPSDSAMAYLDSLYGLAPAEATITVDMLLPSRENVMFPEELAQIDGIGQILARFAEFHTAAKKLVAERQLGADQPQKFSFDDREEPRRVRNFIARHFNGDISETMQQALYYYYVGKLEAPADRDKLMELIQTVEYAPATSSKRRDLHAPDKPLSTEPEEDLEDHVGPEALAIVERLNLKDQYRMQVEVLQAAGLLDSGGEITAIDGEKYHLPTLAKIAKRIEANLEVYQTKLEQGFSQLLLVPFGLSLDKLTETYGEALKRAHAAGKLCSSDGEKLELDTDLPVWVWDGIEGKDKSGELVYFPGVFSTDPDEHHGRTKVEVMGEGKTWQVLLVEDIEDIPADGTAVETVGRTPLTAGRSAEDYLADLRALVQYQHESGLTPEAWLTLALTRLAQNNQALDDWQGAGKSDRLIGSWLPGSGSVPVAFWDRGDRQAFLDRDNSDRANSYDGLRSSVMVL
jgi:MoxR-like ATPase